MSVRNSDFYHLGDIDHPISRKKFKLTSEYLHGCGVMSARSFCQVVFFQINKIKETWGSITFENGLVRIYASVVHHFSILYCHGSVSDRLQLFWMIYHVE